MTPTDENAFSSSAPTAKRRAVRLGKVPMKMAVEFKTKIETIVYDQLQGRPHDLELARWLRERPISLHNRLVRVGLVSGTARSARMLGEFLQGYIDGRTDAKPRTIINLKRAQKLLVEFFGEQKPLGEISEGDADEYWRFLIGKGLHANTARRLAGRAKQFFRHALRKRLVTSNPFADLKCQVQGNPEREYFLSREDTQKLIDACPDAQWRLIIALSRYGGLRCPSEHLALKWGDVDWDKGKLRVPSPKTEHHEGKEFRFVPLFPELRPHLREVYEAAEPGGPEHIITRYRDASANLRTQLQRIITRAGLKPWPKLFHNMRSTRETSWRRRTRSTSSVSGSATARQSPKSTISR